MGLVDTHSIRVVLDAAGKPLQASATTNLTSGSYRVRPLDVGPFDTLEEVVARCVAALDLQGTLW